MWGMLPTFFYRCTLPRRDVNKALQDVVTTEVEALGLELVELVQRGTKSRPVLDVRVDRRDGESVTVEDCARASRAIEAQLDGGALINERYLLEVSSPGVERPLRHAADWRKFVGKRAAVLAPAIGGRVEVTILGVEGNEGEEVVVVADSRGAEQRLPLGEIKEARLVFNWTR
jgi:ribosome maturation factor RimP